MKDGTLVYYWLGMKFGPPSGKARIISHGAIGGSEVVWLEGVTGCVAVSHVEPVEKSEGK